MPVRDDTPNQWTTKELDGFHRAAESLKLYRRAELQDEKTGACARRSSYT